MLEKKLVRKMSNIAHILLPKEMIGQEVYVISQESIRELEDLITMTLLYRKVQMAEQKELKDDLDKFKAEVLLRLKRLEDALTSSS